MRYTNLTRYTSTPKKVAWQNIEVAVYKLGYYISPGTYRGIICHIILNGCNILSYNLQNLMRGEM